MKTILLNGSPRKNQNTAQMLRSAQKGAESAGSETEYVDLFELDYSGCRSCLACKLKDGQRCHCFWKDDLSPLLDRIFSVDALIIGSPVYFGDITSQVHALMERLCFTALSYDDYSSYFKGKINVGVILTMNMPEEGYESLYKAKMEGRLEMLRMLNGKLEILPCMDTLQVKDYSRYNMAGFNEEHKQQMRKEKFPQDLDRAFRLGTGLCQ